MSEQAWWGVLMGAWVIAALPFVCVYTVRAMVEQQASSAWEQGFTKFSMIWSPGFVFLFLPYSLGMPAAAGIVWTVLYAAALWGWWRLRRR